MQPALTGRDDRQSFNGECGHFRRMSTKVREVVVGLVFALRVGGFSHLQSPQARQHQPGDALYICASHEFAVFSVVEPVLEHMA